MHSQVLVPLDGSKNSLKALDVAADLAEKYGSKLVLLHVVPSGEVPKALQKWAKTEQFSDPPEAIYEQAIADGILASAEASLSGNEMPRSSASRNTAMPPRKFCRWQNERTRI
jgi:nucleotide-binding universal stress UspA family protein